MKAQGIPDNERQVFLDNLVGGYAAHLTLSPGITLRALSAGPHQGLALQVDREALQAGQLQRVLERRFEQAVAFDSCFAYLNDQAALVIWHPLLLQRDTLDKALGRMLCLAGLETLDAHSRR